ncbi:MAG: SPFH/Band 7/PHB domain protein [Armatimonadetes bacterium CG_4_10_14_3_um_filter_66_18]|nr:SPFH/Band 7/PHB domain protein [Armatimonadota bacterium]PIU89098.1 MAG: SPFH/Band 7/PHB domain protein [Armatimonadetes bacterium CG06_land_8_20_14_3_00_66_21]PIW20781.1 MAG: SPFH/Band 7/PHB domain protein [Armatimonadetes bacterium CG17_big_fil_post_rev_8_21_14_2_50_66_6]PIX49387.1 MAG: SPFH/Band 7/PHB domain protein [Armatimonadetes bacterium CG_4_8_14_3_um_filter_66_20]PIY37413.1 MAG: SPFH/Band 7/PHB domain protein [Armatimonadetes bacterium CG_4_10_14_3_um_filter_66_18]PIZ35110.1 MAG: 
MILAVLVVIFAALSLRIIQPYEKGLVERLGRYVKTLDSGLNIIIPFVEAIRKVDMRERVIDVPPQEVITKDNVIVTVDAVVYFEVTDPTRVVYQVENFLMAATKLAQTNLRNVIGDMELDESLTSREKINVQLREVLDDATDKWGVRVTRVEIQKVDPPRDINEAMSRQMKAERTKRANILDAEGFRQAEIEKAEGEKRAVVLAAEGKAEAIRQVADAQKYEKLTLAQGEAEAIATVYNAIHAGKPTNDLIAIKYLETLGQMADGKATKIFLPLEASGVLGTLGGMAELLKTQQEAAVAEKAPTQPK